LFVAPPEIGGGFVGLRLDQRQAGAPDGEPDPIAERGEALDSEPSPS
jgi:hypothetical protein